MPCQRGCCPTQADHYRSISLATSGELVRVNQAEQVLARDMAAYKTLVDQGLEPHKLTGAHDLARDARSAAQIEGRPDDHDG